MTAATTQASTKLHQTRIKAIEPFLEKLGRMLSHSTGPLEIRLYESQLALDPWEDEQLRLFIAGDSEQDRSCALLVVQGAALLLKSAADIDGMMSAVDPVEEQPYTLQADLMLDTAIGMALLREMQKAQDDLVRIGEVTLAKKLSRFQHKLRNALADIRKMIGESEHERAEQISDDLTDQPRQESASLDGMILDRAAAKAADEYARASLRDRAADKARAALAMLPSRTDILLYAFALTLAIWLGAVKLPQIIRMEPAALTKADFPQAAVFLDVTAKPPSVFIEVDGAAWREMDERRRIALVEMTGEVLESGGYSGALLRTERGRPLAQWMKSGGAILIETTESTGESPQAIGPDSIFVP
jgi:hypothetical protein